MVFVTAIAAVSRNDRLFDHGFCSLIIGISLSIHELDGIITRTVDA